MIKFGKDLTQCIFIKTTLHHFTLFKTKGYAKGFSVIKRHRKSRKSIPRWRQYFMYPIRENANERLCVWLWEIWGISFHRFSTRRTPSMCWNYRHPEERKERVFLVGGPRRWKRYAFFDLGPRDTTWNEEWSSSSLACSCNEKCFNVFFRKEIFIVTGNLLPHECIVFSCVFSCFQFKIKGGEKEVNFTAFEKPWLTHIWKKLPKLWLLVFYEPKEGIGP